MKPIHVAQLQLAKRVLNIYFSHYPTAQKAKRYDRAVSDYLDITDGMEDPDND